MSVPIVESRRRHLALLASLVGVGNPLLEVYDDLDALQQYDDQHKGRTENLRTIGNLSQCIQRLVRFRVGSDCDH